MYRMSFKKIIILAEILGNCKLNMQGYAMVFFEHVQDVTDVTILYFYDYNKYFIFTKNPNHCYYLATYLILAHGTTTNAIISVYQLQAHCNDKQKSNVFTHIYSIT